MASYSSSSLNLYRTRFQFRSHSHFRRPQFNSLLKFRGVDNEKNGSGLRHRCFQITALDEDFDGAPLLDDWGDNEGTSGYMFSSSDGEESDGDVLLNPISDIELPSTNDRHAPSYDSLAVTAHRFAMLAKRRKKRKIKYGILNNVGLIAFLTVLLLLVDLCAWRIVRLPLEPFYLMRPFFISAALASCAGYICVPLLNVFKMHQVLRKTGPAKHSSKKGTPTMGGLFFIPVGITVARTTVGYSSIEVSGASAVTLGFAAIGLLDDVLSLVKNHNHGLSGWIKIFLEVAVGTWFSFWLDATSLSLPYSMKMLVPLPAPLGLVFLGKCYLLLTSFCFVSMGNGVNLTDGLDGLAGGTSALAFIGMSVAVLPLCPDLAVFGASMAGACVGFLLHNRYRASVFMGDTGSLALGGALAAMASCTGMFFPLFVASGIFVLEVLSVIMQISYSKATKHLQWASRRLLRMAPFHHHLELSGIREPFIVAGAYIVTSFLCVLAGYIGLISA